MTKVVSRAWPSHVVNGERLGTYIIIQLLPHLSYQTGKALALCFAERLYFPEGPES